MKMLNPNKAYGHSSISILMLKICGSTIYRPVEMAFKDAQSTGLFLSEWTKGNIAPIHKKGDKLVLKNYCSVSVIFNKMFSFLL